MTTVNQAMRQVAALKKKISDVETRMRHSVRYEEGKPPAFDFVESGVQRSKLVNELVYLKTAIACASANNTIESGDHQMTMTEAVRSQEELKATISFYESLVEQDHERRVETESNTEYNDEYKPVTVKREIVYIHSLPSVQKTTLLEGLREMFAAVNAALEDANHRVHIDDKK